MLVIETLALGIPLYPGVHATDSKQFTYYRSPTFGFEFHTVEEATSFEALHLNLVSDFQVVDVDEAQSRFDAWLKAGASYGSKEYVKVPHQQPVCWPANADCNQRRTALLHWWLVDYTPANSNVPQSVYGSNSDAMWQEFQQLRVGMGYRTDTNQANLCLHAGPAFQPQQAAEEVWLAVPLIRDSWVRYIGQDDQQGRVIDVSTGSWREHNNGHLMFKPDTSNPSAWQVTLLRYSYEPTSSICKDPSQLALFLNQPFFKTEIHDD